MPDEPTQSTDTTTEEQKKGSLGGTSKGSQSYGTRAPEVPKSTNVGGTSKGNSGSYGAK